MIQINTLGISGWKDLHHFFPGTNTLPLHDAAATLITDGSISAVAEEERFTRHKHGYNCFPVNATAYCLAQAGLALDDIDSVGIYWDMPHSARLKSEQWNISNADLAEMIFPKKLFGSYRIPNIEFVNHHLAHAVSAYSCSGFENTLILVVDGQGEQASTSLWLGKNGHCHKLREMDSTTSLGYFYEAVTEYVGLESNEPGKTMGLASYGTPVIPASEFFVVQDGQVSLKNPEKFDMTRDFDEQMQMRDYWFRQFSKIIPRPNESSAMFNNLTGHISRNVKFDSDYVNLAASGQRILEDVVTELVEWGISHTGVDNVSIAGGVGLNCVMNGRLLQNDLVRQLFIQPMAHDASAALGAAINLSHDWKGVFSHVYLGPGYSEDEIRAVLEEYKLSYSETANIEERVAGLLAQENLVGWFQGRMEVGPRALGNRTILANPINPDAKDRVNQYVKFREAWRPFAPSILQEAKEDYLVGAADSPYMILSFDVPTNAQPKIPGVLHVDGTVRAQTVAKDANPRYWNMIKAFEAKTGVPVVINTSYNIKGEPIVCTPRDAIRTFFSCGLDYLAIGNFLVSKK